jgi:type II secretion system protein D
MSFAARVLVAGILILWGASAPATAQDEPREPSKVSREETEALRALAERALADSPTETTSPAQASGGGADRSAESQPPEEEPQPDREPRTRRSASTGDRLADLLSQVQPGMVNLSGAEMDVQVVGDTVILQGSEEDLAMIELLLTILDQSIEPKELRVVKLEQKDANEIARTLEEAVNKGIAFPNMREEDKVSITAISPNTLLVGALPRDMDFVIETIHSIDEVEDNLGRIELMTFTVQHRRAKEVATQLEGILRQILEAKGIQQAKSKFQIKPIDANNTILITAPQSERETIQGFISAIDVEPARGWSEVKLTLYPLLRSKAEDLAKVVTDLLKAPETREETEEVIRRLLMSVADPDGELRELPPIDLDKPIRIIPDSGTNSLIVATVDENVQPMGELIRLLDQAALARDVVVRVIPIRFADAATLADLLGEMFTEGEEVPKEPVGTSGTDTIRGTPVEPDGAALVYKIGLVADARTNTLIVSGRQEQIELVERVIAQLDQPARSLKFALRLIPMAHGDVGRIGKIISDLMDKRLESLEGTDAKGTALERERVFLSADIRTNSLIVSASEENFAEITDIVRQLDTPSEPTYDTVRVVPCQRLSAADLKTKIDELWTRKAALRSELELPEDTPVIVADERSNALLVASSVEDYEEIARLVATLDEQPLIEDTRLFRLRYADARELADQLDKLFQGLAQSNESLKPPTLLPDARTNSLMVAATQDAMERAEAIIGRMDVEAGPKTATFQIYPLRYGSAGKLAVKMQELFDSGREGQDQQRTPVVVMADEASNSLIASASRDDHQVIVELLGLLDQPSTLARQFEIFPLRQAKSARVAEKLGELLQSRAGTGGGGGSGDVSIAAVGDERTNSIIVWASPTEMENIADMIRRLDTTTSIVERAVKLIQLKQALAGDFATVLDETFLAQDQGEDQEALFITFTQKLDDGTTVQRRLIRQDIKITPDPRTNSLMVMAPSDSMDMLEALIQDFDRIQPIKSELRLFPLMNADAETMSEQLTNLFEAKQGEGDQTRQQLILGSQTDELEWARVGQELRFAADTRTNTLVAAGAEIDLRMVEELVRYLDSQDVEDRLVEVYPVKFKPPQDIARAVQDFNERERDVLGELDDQTSRRRRAERQVSVVSLGDDEQGSSSLIVGASRRQYPQVMEMLYQLDRPEPQVRISVLVAELTLTDNFELGIELAGQELDFSRRAVLGPNGIIEGPDFDIVAGTDIGAAGSLQGFNFTVSGEDFSFLLHALKRDSRLEVLSRPTLTVRNGEQGIVNISDQVPIVSEARLNDTGQTQTSVVREDVGLVLTATPHISPDGYVTLEIKQEVSNLSGDTIQITEGVTQPIFQTREVTTNVTVRDGETVVIGGLITERESEGQTRIPFFGDIPVLGRLFRTDSISKSRTELMVVLTVDVLQSDEDMRRMSREERDLFALPDRILRHPLMEGLRIRADEPSLGPESDGPPGGAPNGAGQTAPSERYGPTPRQYGPMTNRPTSTTASTGSGGVDGAPSQAARGKSEPPAAVALGSGVPDEE